MFIPYVSDIPRIGKAIALEILHDNVVYNPNNIVEGIYSVEKHALQY